MLQKNFKFIFNESENLGKWTKLLFNFVGLWSIRSEDVNTQQLEKEKKSSLSMNQSDPQRSIS